MTCIIITFNPFRKIELKFTNNPDLIEEKAGIKRSLTIEEKTPSTETKDCDDEIITAAAKKIKQDSMITDESNVAVN